MLIFAAKPNGEHIDHYPQVYRTEDAELNKQNMADFEAWLATLPQPCVLYHRSGTWYLQMSADFVPIGHMQDLGQPGLVLGRNIVYDKFEARSPADFSVQYSCDTWQDLANWADEWHAKELARTDG